MVYFVQYMRQRKIKIGYVDVMPLGTRIHQLKLDLRGTVRLLATIEGTRERELHRQFQENRLLTNTRYGDWFRMSDDLCCFISRLNPKLRLLADSGKIWQDGVDVVS